MRTQEDRRQNTEKTETKKLIIVKEPELPSAMPVFELKTQLHHSSSYLIMPETLKKPHFYAENATYSYLFIVIHGYS